MQSTTVCIRLSMKEREKLDALASAMDRTISSVLRRLIARAELTGMPDICLGEEMRWTIGEQVWAITIADLRLSPSTNDFGFSAIGWPETGKTVSVYTDHANTRSKEMRNVDARRSIPVMRETRCEALAALAERLLAAGGEP